MKPFLCAALALVFVTAAGGPARADEKDPNAILDKAIKATGGEEKLKKLDAMTWKSKATITFNGDSNAMNFQSTVQGLDRYRAEFEGEFGGNPFKGVVVLNGKKGWRKFGDQTMDMDEDAVANEKRQIYLQVIPIKLVILKDKAYKLEAVGEQKVGDKPAAGIKVTGPDGKDFTIYFDKESGLPVRTVAKVVGFNGEEFTQETTYSRLQGRSTGSRRPRSPRASATARTSSSRRSPSSRCSTRSTPRRSPSRDLRPPGARPGSAGLRGTTTLATWIITGWPCWLRVVFRIRTMPRSGFDCEGRTSRTSDSTRSTSPGRTGRGQRIASMPAPTSPPATLKSLSTRSRIARAAVCQPLATSPPKMLPAAASSSRWNGCGSKSAANALMRSRSTVTDSEWKVWPTVRSSRYSGAMSSMACSIGGSDLGRARADQARCRSTWGNSRAKSSRLGQAARAASRSASDQSRASGGSSAYSRRARLRSPWCS